MYKYIFFIIFGIILFLIYNNIDGLSIGEDCEDTEECNNGGGNCLDGDINKCYCYFNKCKMIDSVNRDRYYDPNEKSVCSSGGAYNYFDIMTRI